MKKFLIATAAVLMLGMVPNIASARSHFFLGLNFGIPLFGGGYRDCAPVYVASPPVVYAPAPVYAPPQAYYAPAPTYYAPAQTYYAPAATYVPAPVYAPAPVYYYQSAPVYAPSYYGGISIGIGSGYRYHDFGGGYHYRR
jgi:hypothetical protein